MTTVAERLDRKLKTLLPAQAVSERGVRPGVERGISPIEAISWDFLSFPVDPQLMRASPKEGVFGNEMPLDIELIFDAEGA